MKIILNGEEKSFDSSISVEELIKKLNLDSRKIAIERNLEIVSKSQYDSVLIESGDRLEIVHFIGGG